MLSTGRYSSQSWPERLSGSLHGLRPILMASAALTVSAAVLTACGGSATSLGTNPSAPSSLLSGTWSRSHPIPAGDAAGLYLSCPSASFCAGVNTIGDAFTYSGGSWSSDQQITSNDTEFSSVSCPTSNFCVAVGQGGGYLYSDGSWSFTQGPSDAGDDLDSVSCPTTHYCMAVSKDGYAYTYSNGSWSGIHEVTSSDVDPLLSISCASVSFCIAVDQSGEGYVYSRGSWSKGRQITAGALPLYSVSCPTSSFCAATSTSSRQFADFVYTYSNGSWSHGERITSDSVDSTAHVSCWKANLCRAIGLNEYGSAGGVGGYAYTYLDGSWSRGQLIGSGGDYLQSISCPTANFCAVGGASIFVYTYESKP